MWNVKKEIIPIMTRGTGNTSKSFRKYPSNTSAKE
jgi:hypothetical protein